MAAAPTIKDLKIVFRIVRCAINEPRGIPRIAYARHQHAERARPWALSIFCCAAAALEVLLTFARFGVNLVGLVFLHLGASFRFVPPNNAAPRGSQNSMVVSIMARDATDDGAAIVP